MKNLQNFNGRWKLRLRVPNDCRDKLGRLEFVKSLGAISKPEAETRAHALLAEWKRKILEARKTPLSPLLLERVPDSVKEETKLRVESLVDQYPDWTEEVDAESMYVRAATVTAQNAGLVPDTSERSENAVAEALGYYCIPSSHLDEYVKVKLQDLKPRSQNEHISVLKNELFKFFPKIGSSFDRYAVLTWWEAYLGRDEPPAAATLRKYLSHVTAYMRWLIAKGYTDKPNYFADLEPVTKRDAARKRRRPERKPFRDEELARLYSAILDRNKSDGLKELFLLATFTGCRIEEICQLKSNDIYQTSEGIGYIDIPESKTSKGQNRLVPIHPKIEHLILDKAGYIIDIGKICNQYGERSGPLGKKFSRLKKELGFGEDKVFHSLRKTFIDQLKANDTPEVLAADIVGHEVGTMTYGVYASGAPVAKLAPYVYEVCYPELEKAMAHT